MKFSHILPLAAVGAAFVLPSEEVLREVAIEDNHRDIGWYEEIVSEKDAIFESLKDRVDLNGWGEWVDEVATDAEDVFDDFKDRSRSALDQAFDYASETATVANSKFHEAAFDVESWLETAVDDVEDAFDGGHHGPPHHGRPGRGRRPPHHRNSNLTVYQMIAESKYTTKLAELINKYDDLVDALNSTKANYTVFAPTDKAFAKIPDHAPKPSKEFLEKVLSYHVVPELYPAGRVLVSHTAPTLLKSKSLGVKPLPQRLAFKIGFRGLTVNFYSRIIAANIVATNGVIHGVDSILIPPPSAVKSIQLFPGEFSTLELGLVKTGLLEKLNTTNHAGGTIFAPSNWAFQKLGPKINAFLFSSYGQKYLKALLEYHVSPNNTLYSDAYYKASSSSDVDESTVPKGYSHVDLPTLLKDRKLAVDIARYGGFISMKINAFSRVAVQDGIVKDGVIHVVGDVLVPPKKIGAPGADEEVNYWQGEEMSVEEFKERLGPYVEPKTDL